LPLNVAILAPDTAFPSFRNRYPANVPTLSAYRIILPVLWRHPDMWKAAGADAVRRPVDWLRSSDSQRFIRYLDENGIVGNSHIELVRVDRSGQEAGTWAHWQVALAYAKYLSPEFHAWCNEVVRAHMEGAKVKAAVDDDTRFAPLEAVSRPEGRPSSGFDDAGGGAEGSGTDAILDTV
jgi:hypothetical protein